MSNTNENGVFDKHKSNNKGVCDRCGVCRCCDAPPVFDQRWITYFNKLNHKVNRKKFTITEQQYTLEEIDWAWHIKCIYVMT